jgi:hypothetical protein
MLPLLLPCLLAACGEGAPVATTPSQDPHDIMQQGATIGMLTRAAPVCGIALPVRVQDRAARIEAAVLRIREEEGGLAARDAFLHALQPPEFDPRRRGRDRDAWCDARRAEIARMDAMLSGPEGEALVQQAESAAR